MPVPSGKTLDTDLFGSDAGWNKTTSAGSYAVSGGKGNLTAGTGGLNSLVLIRTAGTTSLPFAKYSMDFNAEAGTNHNFILSLSVNQIVDYAGTFGVYVNGGGGLYVYDNGVVDVGYGAIDTSVYNVSVIIHPNYTAKVYVNSVLQYTSVNFAGPLITDDPLYWHVHVDKCNGNGVLQIDNFLVTDQSCIEIERSTTGGGVGFSQIATVDLGTQSYSDSGLDPGTVYYYRVRQNRGGDEGPYSSEVSDDTDALPQSGSGGSDILSRLRRDRSWQTQ